MSFVLRGQVRIHSDFQPAKLLCRSIRNNLSRCRTRRHPFKGKSSKAIIKGKSFIHSAISIAPLQVLYYSEAGVDWSVQTAREKNQKRPRVTVIYFIAIFITKVAQVTFKLTVRTQSIKY